MFSVKNLLSEIKRHWDYEKDHLGFGKDIDFIENNYLGCENKAFLVKTK